MALATASVVFDTPRSLTSQTAKYRVATFIEKIVFEKSYSAQLMRSMNGARVVAGASLASRTSGIACSEWATGGSSVGEGIDLSLQVSFGMARPGIRRLT